MSDVVYMIRRNFSSVSVYRYHRCIGTVAVPLQCRYVHYRRKNRHYIGNRHYSAYRHYWLFPSVPNDSTGAIRG